MRKYRISRQLWCKKQGNKGRENVIVPFLWYYVVHVINIEPLLDLFTKLLPSNLIFS